MGNRFGKHIARVLSRHPCVRTVVTSAGLSHSEVCNFAIFYQDALGHSPASVSIKKPPKPNLSTSEATKTKPMFRSRSLLFPSPPRPCNPLVASPCPKECRITHARAVAKCLKICVLIPMPVIYDADLSPFPLFLIGPPKLAASAAPPPRRAKKAGS